MDVEPLTITEQNVLKWVLLCEKFGRNPVQASALDFEPKREEDR